MNRDKYVLSSLTLLFTIIISANINLASAYNIQEDSKKRGLSLTGGHEEITEYAIESLTYDSILHGKIRAAKDVLVKAVAAEDIGLLGASPMLHFYNPTTNSGLSAGILTGSAGMVGTPLNSAKFLAIANYDAAYHAYILGGESGTDTAWSRLGHTLHLLQDMSAPSHVNSAPHMEQAATETGYEWWVAKNWKTVLESMDGFFKAYPTWKEPSIAGTIDGFMDIVANRTYADNYRYDYSVPFYDYSNPLYAPPRLDTVSDSEAAYNAKFLIPQAVRSSGTLFKMFCMHVNCTGTPYPPPNNTKTPGHPDDNFDVSSRFIAVEELDATKQTWKDLYGRTGIKKGYNELFLEKIVAEAYGAVAATRTEADYKAASQQFLPVINHAQKEAKHSFEDTYYASADVALLSDAFVDNAAELLLKRLKEPIRKSIGVKSPNIKSMLCFELIT